MVRKFLKLLGVGVLSGAACRSGSMLIDALFPKGFGGFLSRFNKPRDESVDQPEKKYLQLWGRG